MSEWNVIHFMNATPEEQRDPRVVGNCAEVYRAFKPKRAEIIEATLSVEGLLDQVLLDLLVGRDPQQRGLVAELILLAEFCTSFQKWKILRNLMSAVPLYFEKLSDAQGKELRSDIHTLIEHRNKFAHGDLIVSVAENYNVYIRYYKDGTQYLQITDQFLSDLIAQAKRCRRTLWTLHERFGTDLQTTVVE